jgi:hypothetical protein
VIWKSTEVSSGFGSERMSDTIPPILFNATAGRREMPNCADDGVAEENHSASGAEFPKPPCRTARLVAAEPLAGRDRQDVDALLNS